MPTIRDIEEFNQYLLDEVAPAVDGLRSYEYADAGTESEKTIQGHFNNRYAGPVLMMNLFEAPLHGNRAGLYTSTLGGQLMVLVKPDDDQPANILRARNRAWKMILRVLGKIREDYEDSRETPGSDQFMFEIFDESLRVTDRVANVLAYGWTVDFDLALPVNHLLFPD